MLHPSAIHQFSPACLSGDGIGHALLFIQRMLRHSGLDSEIYCLESAPELRDQVRHLDDYRPDPDQALLIHHGIGTEAEARLRTLTDRRFMVFHNITPAEYFAPADPLQPLLALGWRQLDAWRDWLDGAIADSPGNLELLGQHGYRPERCAAIPLLVDLARYRLRPEHACRPLDDGFRLLFVGRIMPHKNQHALIETLAQLHRRGASDVRLTLVGLTWDAAYRDQLLELIRARGLEDSVILAGKVEHAELLRHYQQADLYVSLSQHEGFGMPLIEAMAQRLPVLAADHPGSDVAATIGEAGLILADADPSRCAEAILALVKDPRRRARLAAAGETRAQSFQPQRLYDQLRAFMARQQIALPEARHPDPLPSPLRYRIEGPFDSSYSLAIVNRNLALALERRHPGAVGLYSTEGPSDFAPDQAFLAAHPVCQRLYQRGLEHPAADCALRLLYPARVSAMKGIENALGCYGWEESALPSERVAAFNRHLQCVTSMSRYVSKVLVDNGVQIPTHTIGIGADHILDHSPDASSLPAIKAELVLLHISSCFPRKGVDVLLAAYAQRFSAADDVTLVIKTFANPHHRIGEQLAAWRAANTQAPEVILIERELSPGAIRALYQRADALIAPSRGEGFGLPMAEAMLHRLPVIVTGYGGQRDFCTEATSWLIDYRFARAQTHMELPDSLWVEPDVDHLARLLGEFHAQQRAGTLAAFTAARVEQAERLIRERYTWNAVAARLDAALARQHQLPVDQTQPRFGCVTTWNVKCGIATYSRKLLASAFSDALILANDDVEPLEDDGDVVRRCWTGHGQTDQLDRLERAILDAGLEQVLIQFNFSFFDLAALARLIDALDQRGVQILITFHSTADVWWGETLKTLRALLPQLHRCARVLVHSVADVERLRSWGLVDNVTLLPQGVERSSIEVQARSSQPMRYPLNRLRRWLGFNSQPNAATPETVLQGKRVIASYGFLLPHKGIQLLIEAFARLCAQDSSLHLLLLNAEYPAPISAHERALCQQLIERLGLGAQATLIADYLDDQASFAWLAQSEMIVYPYQHTQESSSAAVRWGLATGKPVVCTPQPIFEDVAEAVHFLPGADCDAIHAGLAAVLNDPDRLAALAPRQQRWLQQHDWNQVSQRLAGLCGALWLETVQV